MEKYKIQSNLLRNGKWRPAAYLLLQDKNNILSESSEFIEEERFDTKEKADNCALNYLLKTGVDRNDIKIL